MTCVSQQVDDLTVRSIFQLQGYAILAPRLFRGAISAQSRQRRAIVSRATGIDVGRGSLHVDAERALAKGNIDNANDLACDFRGIGVGGLEAPRPFSAFSAMPAMDRIHIQ